MTQNQIHQILKKTQTKNNFTSRSIKNHKIILSNHKLKKKKRMGGPPRIPPGFPPGAPRGEGGGGRPQDREGGGEEGMGGGRGGGEEGRWTGRGGLFGEIRPGFGGGWG